MYAGIINIKPTLVTVIRLILVVLASVPQLRHKLWETEAFFYGGLTVIKNINNG